MSSIADLRENYSRGGLSETEAGTDPIALFHQWFNAAVEAGVPDPNAMTLSTVGPNGKPSARVVLLKGLDHGFTFFTNYESRKGREIASNPAVALTFLWHQFERQVRIEGNAERVTEQESDAYFRSRPVGSRLGAWASPQSQVVASREDLEQRHAKFESIYAGIEVPRPTQWGGYRVLPELMEFWQGRPNRLHDRIRFRRSPGGWVRQRLAP